MTTKLNTIQYGYQFWCPGCRHPHSVWVSNPNGQNWNFNGDVERPTFGPSILVTNGHFLSSHKEGDSCWCTFNKKYPDKVSFECIRCHTYVTDGKIQFLSDSSHHLAGQTVDLPDWFEHNN